MRIRPCLQACRRRYANPRRNCVHWESERLDRLLDGVWAKATKGQTPAIRAAIALMERRARLWGLDQPTKLEIGRLLESSDWIMVRDRIKTALEPFPEALQSVIEALRGIDSE